MGFSGMPYIVVLSEIILNIALWVKHSRWPPYVQGQAIISDIVEAVSWFWCLSWGFQVGPMLYIVVLSENILDIALLVKNSRWLLFVKGRSINGHHF